MERNSEEVSSSSNSILHNFDSISEIVGYFSVDEHRNYVPDSSTLMYYNPPKAETCYLDLNQGVESTVNPPASVRHEHLNFLLQWIKSNRSKIEAPVGTDNWIEPDFVCPAGLLSSILSIPFCPDHKWAILAAKWRGTIYLYVDITKRDNEDNKIFSDTRCTTEDIAMKFINWGYKFEQYVLSENPCEVPVTSTPVIQSKEFRCVFQRRLGKHKILFDSVMKGVCSEKRLTDPLPLDDLKFIETKTSLIVYHPGHARILRQKFLSWWSRIFLTDIETLLCGFRNKNGIVRQLRTYNVDEMISMSKAYWDPSICVNFGEALLTQIREAVANDCDKSIYRFEKISNEGFQIDKIIKITELSPSSENFILPTWYMEEAGMKSE